MSTKQSMALLDLLTTCRPDDPELEHERQVTSIVLSDAYQDLVGQNEFRDRFDQEFSVQRLRNYTGKTLDAIPKKLLQEKAIRSILLSEDYQTLACRDAFRPWFNELFSETQIRTYSAAQLKELAQLLPQVSLCLDNIIFSLRNGAGPELTENDKPNFADLASLERLNKKLDKGTGKNYTNIDADDFMAIFDQDTAKSIGDKFQELPVECTDYKAALDVLFSSQKFCISDQEIQELEAAYSTEISKAQAILDVGKGKRWKRRIVKAFVGLGVLFIPSLFAGATGLLSSGAMSACTLGELIFVVLFWLRG